MNIHERPFASLPVVLRGLFVTFLVLQVVFIASTSDQSGVAFEQLDAPAHDSVYRVASLGSERLLAYLLTLELQLHDAQAGVHIPYTRLNFEHLREWLLTLYRLNPLSDYPAFLATRVYGQNPDPDRVRIMIGVVEDLFERNPRQHWRRMTEACLLAKHQLKDLPLALSLARKLSEMPGEIKTPFWARDMELILLDEMDEKESARMLISSMLQSGDITDNDERRFLEQRLLKIQQELSSRGQSVE